MVEVSGTAEDGCTGILEGEIEAGDVVVAAAPVLDEPPTASSIVEVR